jgi:hypothetical protein
LYAAKNVVATDLSLSGFGGIGNCSWDLRMHCNTLAAINRVLILQRFSAGRIADMAFFQGLAKQVQKRLAGTA